MGSQSIQTFFSRVFQAGIVAGMVLVFGNTALAAPDYMTAPFSTKRVLDWGSRPDWSPDGTRLAFTETDTQLSFAYELDLETNTVRCLTCQFGISGHVSRVYYMPDSSFLLVAPADMGEGGPNTFRPANSGGNVLLWLSADLDGPMQRLTSSSFGEVAISRSPDSDGATRISWGEYSGDFIGLKSATLSHSGGVATLTDVQEHFEMDKNPADGAVTFTEAYGFMNNDQEITFFTSIEIDGIMDGEMYKLNVNTGEVSPLYLDANHNETHLFPGDRFGLEESNRVSDPNGKWRGVSVHPGWSFEVIMGDLLPEGFPEGEALHNYSPYGDLKGFSRPFDLFVVDIENPSRVRQLTDVGKDGANAHQSVPGLDGRRIAYAIDPRASQVYSNKGGLYVGEFADTASAD